MSSQRKKSRDVDDGSPVDPANAKNRSTKVTGHPCTIIYRPCERQPPPVEERSLEVPQDSPPPKRPCPPKLFGPCPSSPWTPGKHKAGLNRAQAMEAVQQDQQDEQQRYDGQGRSYHLEDLGQNDSCGPPVASGPSGSPDQNPNITSIHYPHPQPKHIYFPTQL